MVALSEFFVGYRKTALQAGEVLVSVHISKPLPRVARFFKIAKRRMDDISSVAVGIAIHHNGMARIAYGGVAATPVRVSEAERELPSSLERAKRAVAAALAPISDHRASSAYRLAMAQSLLDKFAYEGGL